MFLRVKKNAVQNFKVIKHSKSASKYQTENMKQFLL